MSKTNILVTGGAGYIGSHTCKALARSGYQPVVFDNLCNGHEYAVKWGPLEQGDILDSNRLGQVVRQYQPHAVVHFAALAYVGESVADPAKYWRNNVAGSLSLIDAMVENGVTDIVYSSSCAIYGEPRHNPISESTPKIPVNPYGTTKLVVENYLGDMAQTGKLNSVSLRYFNAAGADPEGEIGEVHEPETHLIPLVLEAIQKQACPFTVFGNDYPTADGSCVRDYIHVSDLAAAHVQALDFLKDNKSSHAFNLGAETGHSVFQVLRAAQKVTGRPVPYNIGKRRPGDPAELVSQSGLARDALQWNREFPDIESIIKTAWDWYRSQTVSTR
jgi:UDP-arabinose 4-epimerase